MSAIAHQAPITDRSVRGDAGEGGGASGGRAHLVLVPTGRGARGTGRPATTDRLSEAAEPMRLTRAGRIVVSLLVAATVALLGVGLAGQLASAGAAPRPVTVGAGDTLSQIAARELPGLPVRDGVIEIQLANRLSTDRIVAGQTLLIPTP